MNNKRIRIQESNIAFRTIRQQVLLIFKVLIFTLSFLIAFNSCNKEDAKLAFNDIPVVESYLIKNNPVSIKVTRKTPYDDNVAFSADSLNQLQVKITYNDQIRIIPSVGKGVYKDATFLPQEGITYKLEFEFNNQLVTSSTDIPTKPLDYKQSVKELKVQSFDFSNGPPTGGFEMPDPVKLTWTNSNQGYYMVVIENIEKSPTAITDFGDNSPPGRFFRNEPTQSNQYEIPSMNFQYYGRHRLILYHLNADYTELYKDNGNSSQNLTNPATNIENGLGIFTGLNADTLMLNVVKK
jgi:hypothetical protein